MCFSGSTNCTVYQLKDITKKNKAKLILIEGVTYNLIIELRIISKISEGTLSKSVAKEFA
jgi:hypothetical protein